MKFGRTFEETRARRQAKSAKLWEQDGVREIVFAWIPQLGQDGRWIWLEKVIRIARVRWDSTIVYEYTELK